MLLAIMQLLAKGIQFLGAAMIVWGAVNLGLTLKDGMQGGGGQLSGAIAMIAGGAIIVAAAVYFQTLDISWTNALVNIVHTLA
ncbi:MAG: hypothetical protein FWC47_09100 [Oscillospiraceae bacterium]|nr:hypothetical protein [Oscillospiraceae bacterium]